MDTRRAEHFAAGHERGAVSLPLRQTERREVESFWGFWLAALVGKQSAVVERGRGSMESGHHDASMKGGLQSRMLMSYSLLPFNSVLFVQRGLRTSAREMG